MRYQARRPRGTLISYAVWSSAASTKLQDTLSLIDQARKRIIQRNASLSIVESLLHSLRISGASVLLYVFAIGSVDKISASQAALAQLTFVGLTSACPYFIIS